MRAQLSVQGVGIGAGLGKHTDTAADGLLEVERRIAGLVGMVIGGGTAARAGRIGTETAGDAHSRRRRSFT